MDKLLLIQESTTTITNGALLRQHQRQQLVIDPLSLQEMMILSDLAHINVFVAALNITSNLMIFKQDN